MIIYLSEKISVSMFQVCLGFVWDNDVLDKDI